MQFKKLMQDMARRNGYELRDANYVPRSTERKIYDYYLGSAVGTIFDVGANVGQTALAFAQAFPDAAIYSFEPFETAFKSLVKNTQHLPGVTCVPFALGSNDAEIEVISEPAIADSIVNSLTLKKQEELVARGVMKREVVQLRTGQSFCREKGIASIDILKIDTEGYELSVLDGFGPMLRSGVRCILCEFCLLRRHAPQTPLLDLVSLLSADGFMLVSMYDLRHEADGSFHYGNALFVREDHLRSTQE